MPAADAEAPELHDATRTFETDTARCARPGSTSIPASRKRAAWHLIGDGGRS